MLLFRPISPWTEARLQSTWSSADSSVSPRRLHRVAPSPSAVQVRRACVLRHHLAPCRCAQLTAPSNLPVRRRPFTRLPLVARPPAHSTPSSRGPPRNPSNRHQQRRVTTVRGRRAAATEARPTVAVSATASRPSCRAARNASRHRQ